MSYSPRRILLAAVLASCFLVGSLAPAASQANVTNRDLLEMDKRILAKNQRILDKLRATQDLLKGVDGKVGQVLTVTNGLTGDLDQVLGIVNGLDADLSQLLGTTGTLTCQLLGICLPTAQSP